MGSMCSDSMYEQIKQKHPKQFQKFLEMTEMSKLAEQKSKAAEDLLSAGIADIKSQNFQIVESKNLEVKNHFDKIKKNLDKHYPGGIAFLQTGKQAKVQDIVGLTTVNDHFNSLKEHLKLQFTKEEDATLQKFKQDKEELMNTLKNQTPKLDLYTKLTPNAKDNLYKSGLNEFKNQIQSRKKEFSSNFDTKLNSAKYLENFKNILPIDKLQNLTKLSKQRLSENVKNYIGDQQDYRSILF